MKRNPYYQLRYFADVPYLVTFGQGHADFLHDLQLNETGVFLWEHLEEAGTPEKLAELCMEHFHCSKEQQDTMQSVVKGFVDGLLSRGILLADGQAFSSPYGKRILEIAGLSCCLQAPAFILSPELLSFESQDYSRAVSPCQNIYMINSSPAFTENGHILIRTDEIIIQEYSDKFILLFPTFQKVKEAHVSKDGSNASIYCASDISQKDAEEFSYAVRMLFFYFALHHQIVALHSASILYEGKLWLFAAASGVGKSTHATLWRQAFGTRIINGDINLITLRENTPIVCGNPWHGTSGIFNTCDFPLGGIILLKQAPEDKILDLSLSQKELFLFHRSISPIWTSALLDKNQELLSKISAKIFVAELACTPNTTAAYCCKEAIDQYMNQK